MLKRCILAENRKLHASPIWAMFFVDFEGNLQDSAVKNALRGIEAEADRMRILGNY